MSILGAAALSLGVLGSVVYVVEEDVSREIRRAFHSHEPMPGRIRTVASYLDDQIHDVFIRDQNAEPFVTNSAFEGLLAEHDPDAMVDPIIGLELEFTRTGLQTAQAVTETIAWLERIPQVQFDYFRAHRGDRRSPISQEDVNAPIFQVSRQWPAIAPSPTGKR